MNQHKRPTNNRKACLTSTEQNSTPLTNWQPCVNDSDIYYDATDGCNCSPDCCPNSTSSKLIETSSLTSLLQKISDPQQFRLALQTISDTAESLLMIIDKAFSKDFYKSGRCVTKIMSPKIQSLMSSGAGDEEDSSYAEACDCDSGCKCYKDCGDRIHRMDRMDRTDRFDRMGQIERMERMDRLDRMERTNRMDRIDRVKPADRGVQEMGWRDGFKVTAEPITITIPLTLCIQPPRTMQPAYTDGYYEVTEQETLDPIRTASIMCERLSPEPIIEHIAERESLPEPVPEPVWGEHISIEHVPPTKDLEPEIMEMRPAPKRFNDSDVELLSELVAKRLEARRELQRPEQPVQPSPVVLSPWLSEQDVKPQEELISVRRDLQKTEPPPAPVVVAPPPRRVPERDVRFKPKEWQKPPSRPPPVQHIQRDVSPRRPSHRDADLESEQAWIERHKPEPPAPPVEPMQPDAVERDWIKQERIEPPEPPVQKMQPDAYELAKIKQERIESPQPPVQKKQPDAAERAWIKQEKYEPPEPPVQKTLPDAAELAWIREEKYEPPEPPVQKTLPDAAELAWIREEKYEPPEPQVQQMQPEVSPRRPSHRDAELESEQAWIERHKIEPPSPPFQEMQPEVSPRRLIELDKKIESIDWKKVEVPAPPVQKMQPEVSPRRLLERDVKIEPIERQKAELPAPPVPQMQPEVSPRRLLERDVKIEPIERPKAELPAPSVQQMPPDVSLRRPPEQDVKPREPVSAWMDRHMAEPPLIPLQPPPEPFVPAQPSPVQQLPVQQPPDVALERIAEEKRESERSRFSGHGKRGHSVEFSPLVKQEFPFEKEARVSKDRFPEVTPPEKTRVKEEISVPTEERYVQPSSEPSDQDMYHMAEQFTYVPPVQDTPQRPKEEQMDQIPTPSSYHKVDQQPDQEPKRAIPRPLSKSEPAFDEVKLFGPDERLKPPAYGEFRLPAEKEGQQLGRSRPTKNDCYRDYPNLSNQPNSEAYASQIQHSAGFNCNRHAKDNNTCYDKKTSPYDDDDDDENDDDDDDDWDNFVEPEIELFGGNAMGVFECKKTGNLIDYCDGSCNRPQEGEPTKPGSTVKISFSTQYYSPSESGESTNEQRQCQKSINEMIKKCEPIMKIALMDRTKERSCPMSKCGNEACTYYKAASNLDEPESESEDFFCNSDDDPYETNRQPSNNKSAPLSKGTLSHAQQLRQAQEEETKREMEIFTETGESSICCESICDDTTHADPDTSPVTAVQSAIDYSPPIPSIPLPPEQNMQQNESFEECCMRIKAAAMAVAPPEMDVASCPCPAEAACKRDVRRPSQQQRSPYPVESSCKREARESCQQQRDPYPAEAACKPREARDPCQQQRDSYPAEAACKPREARDPCQQQRNPYPAESACKREARESCQQQRDPYPAEAACKPREPREPCQQQRDPYPAEAACKREAREPYQQQREPMHNAYSNSQMCKMLITPKRRRRKNHRETVCEDTETDASMKRPLVPVKYRKNQAAEGSCGGTNSVPSSSHEPGTCTPQQTPNMSEEPETTSTSKVADEKILPLLENIYQVLQCMRNEKVSTAASAVVPKEPDNRQQTCEENNYLSDSSAVETPMMSPHKTYNRTLEEICQMTDFSHTSRPRSWLNSGQFDIGTNQNMALLEPPERDMDIQCGCSPSSRTRRLIPVDIDLLRTEDNIDWINRKPAENKPTQDDFTCAANEAAAILKSGECPIPTEKPLKPNKEVQVCERDLAGPPEKCVQMPSPSPSQSCKTDLCKGVQVDAIKSDEDVRPKMAQFLFFTPEKSQGRKCSSTKEKKTPKEAKPEPKKDCKKSRSITKISFESPPKMSSESVSNESIRGIQNYSVEACNHPTVPEPPKCADTTKPKKEPPKGQTTTGKDLQNTVRDAFCPCDQDLPERDNSISTPTAQFLLELVEAMDKEAASCSCERALANAVETCPTKSDVGTDRPDFPEEQQGCCSNSCANHKVDEKIVDTIIEDLETMQAVRTNAKYQFANSPVNNRWKAASTDLSFPATIEKVQELGPNSLFVKWKVHNLKNVAGYEIFLDGTLTNRYYSQIHRAAVICNVDLEYPHRIILRALPQSQKRSNAAAKSNITSKDRLLASSTPGACCPQTDGTIWYPSVYHFEPTIIPAPVFFDYGCSAPKS